jgi:hypothetical protein
LKGKHGNVRELACLLDFPDIVRIIDSNPKDALSNGVKKIMDTFNSFYGKHEMKKVDECRDEIPYPLHDGKKRRRRYLC